MHHDRLTSFFCRDGPNSETAEEVIEDEDYVDKEVRLWDEWGKWAAEARKEG